MIASAVIAAGSLAYGISSDISKQKEGRRMQQEAQKKIDAFKSQDLVNSFRTMQVSQLGADLRREASQVTESGIIDTLQQAGSRAVAGGIGRVQANQNQLNREIAVNLDEQQKEIDMKAAQEDARLQDIIEQRQMAELGGFGQMFNTGMNMKYQGQAGVMNSLAAASQGISAYSGLLKSGNTVPSTQKGGGNFSQFDFSNYGDSTGGVAYGIGAKVNDLVGTINNTPDYAKVYGTNSFGMGQMGTGFGLNY